MKSHGQLTDTRNYAETHDLEGTCFPNLFARKNANMSSSLTKVKHDDVSFKS